MADATASTERATANRAVTLLRTPAVLRLASSCVGSLIAGLAVAGLGTRLVMRLSAIAADDSRIGRLTENGNVVGAITTEGTLALLLFVGLAVGLSTGLLLFVLRMVLPGRLLPLWVSLVLVALASPLVIDPGNADFTIMGNRALNVTMFTLLFPAFGFGSVWVAERFDRWLLQRPLVRLAPLTIAGSVLGAMFGILGLVGLVSVSGPIGGFALVLVVVLGVVAAFASGGVALGAREVAVVVLVVSGATGLVRFVQDARTIVG
ncbi:MAG: hypothetical protein ACXWXB_07765 [Actinomycetota bacterium]